MTQISLEFLSSLPIGHRFIREAPFRPSPVMMTINPPSIATPSPLARHFLAISVFSTSRLRYWFLENP